MEGGVVTSCHEGRHPGILPKTISQRPAGLSNAQVSLDQARDVTALH
jgi:hypothetical protein